MVKLSIQKRIVDWGKKCFGDQMRDKRFRALRLAEEAIEFAQAAGVDREQLALLLLHVYSKPPGDLKQELGGVGVTLFAAVDACDFEFLDVVNTEITRCESKSVEHFRERNKKKLDLGFK